MALNCPLSLCEELADSLALGLLKRPANVNVVVSHIGLDEKGEHI